MRESAPGVAAHPLLCTLPPTCNHRPTPIANTRDLETHYATYHAHVCEESGCGSVFPDARLLELHQTECHDPIAAVRKDKGEKIFACHLASCGRLFLTPKARRLHLIQAHGFPKEYFFAVTNKGVGGLLKKWGEGVSLVRGPWKSRDRQETKDENEELEDSGEDEETVGSHGQVNSENEKRSDRNKLHVATHDEGNTVDSAKEDLLVDGLTRTMDSLNMVPPSVRFGRGGKNGGFSAQNGRTGYPVTNNPVRGGHFRSRGRGRGLRGAFLPRQAGGGDESRSYAAMEVESANVQAPVSVRAPGRGAYGRGGLGWAGRGRAGIVHTSRGYRERGRVGDGGMSAC